MPTGLGGIFRQQPASPAAEGGDDGGPLAFGLALQARQLGCRDGRLGAALLELVAKLYVGGGRRRKLFT